jgi:tetratricopeptide (TPR) repeat protein
MNPMSSLTRALLVVVSLLLAPYVYAQTDDYQEASKLFRAGQHAQALDRVDTFIRSNPKDARARFLKGLILTEQNKLPDAIKIFTALTDDYPELPEPYNNLAVLYASQGQYDKARNALELAIRTHPSYATAHENLGDVYAKMASQAYDKALQIDNSNAAAQTKLGLIKELFSGRGVKPAANRSDAQAKAQTVAAAKPTPPAAAPTPTPAPAAEPARAQKPAEPPAKAVPPPAPAAAVNDAAANDVLKSVNAWARAWSDNDVKTYLSFYASDFQTPRGEPRSDWEAARKLRIAKPKKISVAVESPQVKQIDNNKASVTFRQNYRSPGLNAVSTKTLILVKTGDRWVIQQERIGS